jgi:ribosome assembly protein 4
LASGSGDGTVRLWDVFTQTPLKEIKADNWVMLVVWSPDAERLAYAEKNGNVTIYTPENEHQVKLNGHSKFVTSMAWVPLHLSKSCNRLVSGSKDFTIRLWNTDTGTCERAFGNHTKCVTKVLWSGCNEIISCSEDLRICCFDSNGGYLRELKKHSHWVNSMSLSTEQVIKRGCYEPGKTFDGKDKHAKALELYQKAVEYHKERLVTGSDDFTLMFFELPNKVPIKQMVGHGKPINHVSFSPDGRYIASGSFDKKIKLWDGYTGEFMCTFDGHVGPVYVMSWSADSRFIISASQDSTLKLWDIKTRKLMMDLPGHADQIYALDWDINGRLVASGGKDRQVKLWTH